MSVLLCLSVSLSACPPDATLLYPVLGPWGMRVAISKEEKRITMMIVYAFNVRHVPSKYSFLAHVKRLTIMWRMPEKEALGICCSLPLSKKN